MQPDGRADLDVENVAGRGGPDAEAWREQEPTGDRRARRESELKTLKAPFPWFGGKSRVAPLVWSRFGDVPNFCEAFFGSGSVLLGRPHKPQLETVNDKDGFVCNAWRSIVADPDRTAHYADAPVNECELHAKHIYLVNIRTEFVARLEGETEFYDAKIAGWWLWGIACWIGSGWCSGKGPWNSVDGKLVHLGDKGRGVNRQLVHLVDKGVGVNRKRVHLGNKGRGVNSGVSNKTGIQEWFQALSDRLRRVRVCCGDWSRICGPTPTYKQGLTGVFLDPPYSDEAGRDPEIYAEDCGKVAHDVREWCIQNGDNPLLRIACCGYEGQEMPASWECVAWKAHGGYANQGNGRGRENSHRERVWFSPACLSGGQVEMFERKFVNG